MKTTLHVSLTGSFKFDWDNRDSSPWCLSVVAGNGKAWEGHTLFLALDIIVLLNSWADCLQTVSFVNSEDMKEYERSGWGCSGKQWLNCWALWRCELSSSNDQIKQACVTGHCNTVRLCGFWIALCIYNSCFVWCQNRLSVGMLLFGFSWKRSGRCVKCK